MQALLASVALLMVVCAPIFVLSTLALIAEYMKNPVIELVEELRKKHRDSNEN